VLRLTIYLAAAFALFAGAACGGKSKVSTPDTPERIHESSTTDSPDDLMYNFLSEINDLSDAMEKKEPKDKVEALFQKAEATNKKMRELPLPTEDKKKLEDKHRTEIEKTMGKYFKAKAQYAASGYQVPRFSGMGTPPNPGK